MQHTQSDLRTHLNLGKQIINRREVKKNGILHNSRIASHYAWRFSFIRNEELNHSEVEM